MLEPLTLLVEKLAALDAFGEKELETVFQSVMDHFEIKLGKIAQPVRVALTGTSISPGIFEIIMVLGKDRTMPRLEKALTFIKERAAQA